MPSGRLSLDLSQIARFAASKSKVRLAGNNLSARWGALKPGIQLAEFQTADSKHECFNMSKTSKGSKLFSNK